MLRRTPIWLTAVMVLACAAGAETLAAQAKQGPLPPPSDKRVILIPAKPRAEAPPIPEEELIRAFSAKEETFHQARAGYGYRKTVRIVAYGDNGETIGEFEYAAEGRINAEGEHYEKIVEQPKGSLPGLPLQVEDLEILWRAPLFPLIPNNVAKYNLTYAGKQKVDELSTYLIQVKPKQLDRAHAYFDGVIWVDDSELAVVKSYGRWVTETGDMSTPEMPFAFFETYRENVDGKYWFPSYVRSDAALKMKDHEIPLRLIIRWTDYKPLTPAAPKSP